MMVQCINTLMRSTYSAHCAVQYITLLFIGCISISSLRGFLRNMRKVKTFQSAFKENELEPGNG